MTTVRPGSHVHRLVEMLAYTGEIPMSAVSLFGNSRTWRRLVFKLTDVQEFRLPNANERIKCKLLVVRTVGRLKSVRFHKTGLAVLKQLSVELYRYYMETFYHHQLPGDASHIERNHRVAEAVLMCMKAGVESRPLVLPKLQNRCVSCIVPESPSFYLGKDLKKISAAELNKTMFSRVVGMITVPGTCYAVYNSRSALMKWNGMGEFKTLHSLMEVARLNAGTHEIDSAILFGSDVEVALRTIREAERNQRLEFRFDGIYRHIHFVPMNSFGEQLLMLLTTPDWNEKLLDLLFDPEVRSYNRGHFEYDAYVEGVYIYSHLDGDIARLIRFSQALQTQTGSFEVVCYHEQVKFLKAYLGDQVCFKVLDIEDVRNELFPERRGYF